VTPAVSLRTLLLGWHLSPLVTTPMVGAAVAYLAGVRALAGRHRRWSRGRTASFLAGAGVIIVALDSGLAAYDDKVFALHVVQHLLLAMIAPPLLALGAPVTLALQSTSRSTGRHILAVLHSRPLALVTHPITAWILFAGSMAGLYFTPLYNLSVAHAWIHALVHLHLIVIGVLFAWPVVGLDPLPNRLQHGARLLYVALTIPFHAFVAVGLLSSSAPLFAAHTLADQRAGAGIMWAGGELFTLTTMAVVLHQWMAADARDAARADRRLDADITSS
jgi:cytochrome c oxidase assembly factor CtaG